MRSRTMILWVIVLQFLIPKLVFAGGKNVGQSLMQYLRLEVGAKQVAMGGAYTAMSGDVSDIFWNPAGIANLKNRDVFFSHTNWIADIGYNAIAAGFNAGELGSFVISGLMMDYGTFYGTAVDPNPSNFLGYIDEGTFTVQEWAIGLGYARNLSQQFSIGAQLKYAYQDLGNSTVYGNAGTSFQTVSKQANRSTAVVFDFGTLYYFGFKGFESLRFAMAMQNFSNIQTPLTFKLGLGMDLTNFWTNTYPGYSIEINVDATHPRDYSERLNVGGEFNYKHILSLRAGYKAVSDEQKMSFGLGVTPKISNIHIAINYAYVPYGVFTNTQTLSVGINF